MEATSSSDTLRVGDLEIRPAEGLVLAGDRAVALSLREIGVLVALARRAGRVVRREDLYRIVWGAALRDGDRTVDVYVHRLRSKLEQALPEQELIHTHVGFGYRFSSARSHAFHTRTTGP